jgi:hypothetical protein
MHAETGVCGPERLKILQQVFDSIWQELQREGRAGPDDETLRQWVAAQVFASANRDVMDVEWVRWVVFNSFGTDANVPQRNGISA